VPEYSIIQKIIIYAIPILFAITVHEVAHGWIASKLGDQTARMMGRLTLNPLKHIDPVGTIMVPLFLFLSSSPIILGAAKPVPVDWRNLRKPRQDMAWVALAGPGANLIMLVIWTVLAKLTIVSGLGNYSYSIPFIAMAMVGIEINIALIVLNMLPIPPLDGSRVMSAILPRRLAIQYNKLERYGLLLFVAVMVLLYYSGLLSRYVFPFLNHLISAVKSLVF
jgi:Zn-dependent protease